jgi:uncharacterized membrane protein YfcA
MIDLLTQGTGLSFWVFVGLCASSFLGSFVTAAFGLGGGVLTLATMALALPPPVLIPVHGVVQFGSNLGRTILMLRQVLVSVVPAFLGGTLIGAMVGIHLVVTLPTWVLQTVLAAFILYATWGPRFRSQRPSLARFFAVGAVSTLATMFVGATGALVAPFVAAACPHRQQVVGTHGLLMSIQHGFKVIAFGAIGFAFGPYVPLLVGLLLSGFLGTYAGRLTLNRLPESVFRIGLRLLLTLLVLRLLYSAARQAVE